MPKDSSIISSFSLSSFAQRLWLLNNPTPKPLKAVVIPIQLSARSSPPSTPPARFTRQDGRPTTPGRMSACLCVSFCLLGTSLRHKWLGSSCPPLFPGAVNTPASIRKASCSDGNQRTQNQNSSMPARPTGTQDLCPPLPRLSAHTLL